MRLSHVYVALLAAAVTIAVGVVVRQGEIARFDARARMAEAYAEQQVLRADSLAHIADTALILAAAWRDSADARSARVVERIRYIRVEEPPAPDTCSEWIERRDAIIADQQAIELELRLALAAQDTAVDALRISNRVLRATVDTLRAVLAARPKPRGGMVVGVGAMGGLCTDGRPCAGFGVAVVVPLDPLDLVRKLF